MNLDGIIRTLCKFGFNCGNEAFFALKFCFTSGVQKGHWLVNNLNKTNKKAFMILKSQNYVNGKVKDY